MVGWMEWNYRFCCENPVDEQTFAVGVLQGLFDVSSKTATMALLLRPFAVAAPGLRGANKQG
jgi:hypothetical protein